MRKIKSQTEIDKKKKRNQVIIGVVLVALMTFSTLGYSLMDNKNSGSTNRVEYDGVTLVNSNGLWEIENTKVYFNYLPTELENISVEGSYGLNDYTDQPVYFVNYSDAGELIINNLQGKLERYQDACLDVPCGLDLPIKNCSENLIFVFVDSEEDRVYQKEKCIFISGDAFKGVDAFNYQLFGIGL
jgi:hypothetical protein